MGKEETPKKGDHPFVIYAEEINKGAVEVIKITAPWMDRTQKKRIKTTVDFKSQLSKDTYRVTFLVTRIPPTSNE